MLNMPFASMIRYDEYSLAGYFLNFLPINILFYYDLISIRLVNDGAAVVFRYFEV